MITLTEEKASDLMSGLGNPGVCLSCDMIDEYAGCEPDACNYECPECGENELFGLSEAIIMDKVEITG